MNLKTKRGQLYGLVKVAMIEMGILEYWARILSCENDSYGENFGIKFLP